MSIFYKIFLSFNLIAGIYYMYEIIKMRKQTSRSLDILKFLQDVKHLCMGYDLKYVFSEMVLLKKKNPKMTDEQIREEASKFLDKNTSIDWFYKELPEFDEIINTKRPLVLEEFFSQELIDKIMR